jgi:integrase
MANQTGIRPRHSRGCRSRDGGSCNCEPSFEAWAWSARDRKKLRRTFTGKGALAAAKGWRSDSVGAVRRGTMRAATSTTLREAWETWLDGARDGSIRTRSGGTYKPSTLAGYEQTMNARVLEEFGGARLDKLERLDWQDFADRMLAEGCDASTIRNTLMPVRAVYRRELKRGKLAVNPTSGLELPTTEGRRDRIASPAEAAKLLAALPEADRPLWATALYAGLRRGELLALRFEDIDFAGGVIRVERAYDPKARVYVEPKSKAGRRSVPLAGVLREYLAAQRLRAGRPHGLVFGSDASTPFDYLPTYRRAQRLWKKAKLDPIGLHEARHTFASLMIAAGANVKALAAYMGHSSVTITLDRYGHLLPGNEAEAAERFDVYLEQATAKAETT